MRKLLAFILCAICFLCACSDEATPPDGGDNSEIVGGAVISTAEECAAFFEGGALEARLLNDIDMGDLMLKLDDPSRTVTLNGGGHTIRGAASSVIRLADGCTLILNDVVIEAEQFALGLLGDGSAGGTDVALHATGNAVQAGGSITFLPNSVYTVVSETGSGITADGFFLGSGSRITVAAIYAIRTGYHPIALAQNAQAVCEGTADNVLETEETLTLMEGAYLQVKNTGELNAVRAGAIAAEEGAKLEATGGRNGVGLFVVEQQQDVTLEGFSRSELKIESGDGSITFE